MDDLEQEIAAICRLADVPTREAESELGGRVAGLSERLAAEPDAVLEATRLCLLNEPGLAATERVLATVGGDLPDGPAGAWIGAEILRRRGDVPAYIAGLAELSETIGADAAPGPLVAMVLANARQHAMREWGRGHVDAALDALDILERLRPSDPDIAAERLFVLVMNRIEDPRARAAIQALSDAAWKNRRIALLANFFHIQKSSFADTLAAAARWAAADEGSIEGLERLARQVSLTIAFRQLLGPDGAGPDGRGEPEWIARSKPLLAIAGELFCQARELREFQDQIFHLVLVNRLQVPDPVWFFSLVLEELAHSDIAADWLGQIVAFFVAHNDLPRASRIAERVRRDESLLSCPHLAKFVCLYAQLAGDRDLEARVLAKVLRDQPKPEEWQGNARVQVHELRSRAATIGMDRFGIGEWPDLLEARARLAADFPPVPLPPKKAGRAPRIAIGLFGQLRDPDFTLPQVKSYFLDDLAATELPSGTECRFLLATWNRQARKQLEAGYPIGEFISLLPPEIGHIAGNLNLRTSGDFAHAFPAIFDELLRRSAQAQNEIGAEWTEKARTFFGEGTLIEIADEALVDRDITGFAEVDPTLRANSALRNQFKMYHRIAGIGRLVETWESQTGFPADIIVLARPDMLFEHGSVMRYAGQLLAAGAENTIICDWNPGAMLNEGLGDNIIIGSRRAMATLFAGYARLSTVFHPDAGELAVYRSRIWGHRFLGSSVFGGGIDLGLIPQRAVRWRLHRGQFDLAAIGAAAAADAAGSPLPQVRDSLQRLLAESAYS